MGSLLGSLWKFFLEGCRGWYSSETSLVGNAHKVLCNRNMRSTAMRGTSFPALHKGPRSHETQQPRSLCEHWAAFQELN